MKQVNTSCPASTLDVLRVPGLYLNLTEICLYPQLSAHDSSLAHLYVLADF